MRKIVRVIFVFILSVMFVPVVSAGSNDSSIVISSEGGGKNGLVYVNSSGEKVGIYTATYSTEGEDAYCLHPGRKGPDKAPTTYYEDMNYDLSNCSTSWSYECGLAYILSESSASGYDYRATETALRLYAAYSTTEFEEERGGDGWYDAETGLTNNAKIYQNTAKAIMGWGYNVDNFHTCTDSKGNVVDCKNVLYAEGAMGEALKAGIELFKKAEYVGAQGNLSSSVWAPEVEVSEVVESRSGLSVTLTTNFNDSSQLNIPTSISGYPVTSTMSCTASGCVITLDVVVNVPDNECVFLDFDISFTDSRFTFGSVQRYKPAGGTKQDFLTFVPGSQENIIPITYNWCENEPDRECCPDMSIKEDMPSSCNESTEGLIEDPEMCTIINACDTGRQSSYDYTSKFGLNDKYCSLYCREEIRFTFMDKTEVIAGRQFKYDVTSKIEVSQMLSTVIYGTRQCTSPEILYEKWEEDYLAADLAVASAWNSLKYWETFYLLKFGPYTNPLSDTYGGGTSGCNGCHYDDIPEFYLKWEDGDGSTLTYTDGVANVDYWTSTYSESGTSAECPQWDDPCGDSDSSTPGCQGCCPGCYGTSSPPVDAQNKDLTDEYEGALRSYKSALYYREKLLMDIQNCNLLSKSDWKYLPDTYNLGYAGDYMPEVSGEVAKVYNNIVDQYDFNSDIEIVYADEYGSLVEIGKDEPVQHTITQGWCKDCDYDSYCGGCDAEPAINGGISTKPGGLIKLKCRGYNHGVSCEVKRENIPDNHAANITTSKEQHFWQSQKFVTQLYTGTVDISSNGQGYWIGLDDYIYPIELNKKNGSYGVYVDYSNLGAASRPENIKIDDGEFECAFEVTNETIIYECDPLYDEYCEIECDPRVEECDNDPYEYAKLGYVVRSVDLTELFPTDRQKGMNWANSENVIKAIQSLGDRVYVDAEPQYVIELSPSNIRNIRTYNDGTSYLDYSISCDSSLNCRSDFLTQISNNSEYATYVDYTLGRNKTTDLYNNYYKYGRD